MKKKLTLLYFLSTAFIVDAQYVGIGTTTPQTPLHIISPGSEALRLDAANPYLSLYSAGVYKGYLWRSPNSIEVGSATGSNLPITFAPNGNQLMYIGTNGNVGVGTLSPMQKLHVEGATVLNGNVGIGVNTPGFPLSFSQTLGDKISLWSNSSNSYGFGILGGLLQIHTPEAIDNIGFGYGSSSSFTERMLIRNAGEMGIELNGRILLRNGTIPLDIDYGPGIWLAKADNNGLLGFMGTQNNQNIGFYGGPAGWGFTYDAVNSRVGIGNPVPNAPLSFPPALGKKITLYPGATGDVGMAVQGNLLQIYSDNPNADIAMGYDQAGTFTERLRVKANGSLAVNGNTGTAGQVLQSNGSGTAPAWITPAKIQYYRTNITATTLSDASSNLAIDVPVTIQVNSIITASVTVNVSTGFFNGCDFVKLSMTIEPLNGGGLVESAGKFNNPCGKTDHTIATGEIPLLASNGTMKIFGPGTDGVRLRFVKTSSGTADLSIGGTSPAVIIVKVIPQ